MDTAVTDFLDFNQTPLQVGDQVLFILPRYRCLKKGIILAFTTQKVRVQYHENTYVYQLLQTSNQLVKV
jgi:hypothetical protein